MTEMTRLAGLLGVALLAGTAFGQGRTARTISTVGTGVRIGDTAASRTFRHYSSGLDSLSRSRSGTGTSVLGGGGDLSVRRRSSSGGAPGSMFDPTGLGSVSTRAQATRGMDYGGGGNVIQSAGSNPLQTGRTIAEVSRSAYFGTGEYLAALGEEAGENLLNSDEPISSFVPDRPSDYRNYLSEGEQAFSQGDYLKALLNFEMANLYKGDDPESLLSMMHAKFAIQEYASAGHLLRRALRSVPELMTIPIEIRAFYASPEEFDARLRRLRNRVEVSRDQADPPLLLAYHYWFSGNRRSAVNALQRAGDRVDDVPERLREEFATAVDIMWRGMTATGKVAGTLDSPEFPPTPTETGASSADEPDEDASREPADATEVDRSPVTASP
jgi:hypothetical protein